MARWEARVCSPCAPRSLGVKPLIGPWKEAFGGAWRPLVVISETAYLTLKLSTLGLPFKALQTCFKCPGNIGGTLGVGRKWLSVLRTHFQMQQRPSHFISASYPYKYPHRKGAWA